MNLFQIFKSKRFEEMLEKALNEELSKPQNEIYNELSDYYFVLLRSLKISKFTSFKFPDYDDCRKIAVDGKEYDFDALIPHNNKKATEALCGIDALISNIEDRPEKILKEIERTINARNQKV